MMQKGLHKQRQDPTFFLCRKEKGVATNAVSAYRVNGSILIDINDSR
jgi:hypothetical protein